MTPDIYKVKQIGSGFLAVMTKPVSGEWIDDEFSGIANKEITQIISLLEPHEAYEVGLENEELLSNKHGMQFISYPIEDRGLPESAEHFGKFTKTLYQQISRGDNTVIHCRAGIGRTGIVAAGVLLHSGFSVKEAFDLISSKRGVEVPDTPEQFNWIESNKNIIIINT